MCEGAKSVVIALRHGLARCGGAARRVAGGSEPLARHPAGVLQRCCVRALSFITDRGVVGPGDVDPLIEEPVACVDWRTEEHIVVEVKIPFGKRRDAMNVRLDVSGVEGRQPGGRDQVPVVDERDAVRRPQPGGCLGVGHDVDVAVGREEPLQRPQAVAKFVVVPETAFDVGIQCQGVAPAGAQGCGSTVAASSPGGVAAVDPEVDDIDGRVRLHGWRVFDKPALGLKAPGFVRWRFKRRASGHQVGVSGWHAVTFFQGS